jgi:hypothetical protein
MEAIGDLAMKGALLALFGLIAAPTFGDWIYNLWHGPLHLACHGQLVTDYQGSEIKESKTLHVEIDFGKGTVTVEHFYPIYNIESIGPQKLRFMNDSLGTDHQSTGDINRYTGTISVISSEPKGGLIFDGLCHPAARIF